MDCADLDRIDEARTELHRIVNDREMKDALILIFANKQDLPDGEWRGKLFLSGNSYSVLWWLELISHEKQMYWTFILNNFVFRIIIVISSHGNISCLLAIACKILVASTQFSVALVTRKGAISDPGLSIVALIIVTLSNHGHQQPGDQLEFPLNIICK